MINTFLLVVVLLFALQIAWVKFITKGIRNAGPLPFVLVGNLPLVLYFGTKLELFINHLRNQYGKMFEFWMGWQRVIYVGEPKIIKKILTADIETFEKLHWEKYVLAPVMDGGLIILSGEEWKNHHRTINTFFNSELYIVLCKEIVLAFERVWPKGEQFTPLKLQTEFRKLSSEVLANLIFGWSFQEKGALKRFVDTIELLNHDLEERSKDILKLRPYIAPFEVAASKKVKEDSEQELLGYIRQAREEFNKKANTPNTSPKFRPLVNLMLADKEFSDFDILHEIKTLFGASETTVHLLTWSVYEISKNPRVEAKLLRELEEISGDNQHLNMDQLNRCSYLGAVINECLRFYPPAPAMFRQAARDCELNENIFIDKGTVVAICPFFMHKDPDYWESPTTFMPERFLETADCKEFSGENINNPAFIPFGNGKRQCIGKRYSLVEASVMLAGLLKQYQFNLRPNQTIEPCTDILNRPRYGIEMTQHLRKMKDGANI